MQQLEPLLNHGGCVLSLCSPSFFFASVIVRAQLSGHIPTWRVAHCLKAANVQLDPGPIIAKYTGLDQRFRWLEFVQALEKPIKSFGALPRSTSALSRSSSVAKALQRASSGQLPPLMGPTSLKRLIPKVRRRVPPALPCGPEGHPCMPARARRRAGGACAPARHAHAHTRTRSPHALFRNA